MANASTDAARQLGQLLLQLQRRLITAESCTGGGIGAVLTEIPGSSAWFEGGIISYSNALKTGLLGVSPAVLDHHGAVSAEVVAAMTRGALACSTADMAVAVSGVAGPGGGSADKPVGTVWIGWQHRGQPAITRRYQFDGDRQAVRQATIQAAIAGLILQLSSQPA
jgi:nicotinamide-nucleotide amidase